LRGQFSFVELHGCTVGNTTGETTFFIDAEYSGYSSLGRPVGANEKSKVRINVSINRSGNLVRANDVDAIKIDDDGLNLAGFIESHLYPRRTMYYFAIPRERRAAFRERARSILRLRA
jgi:hypothetical protein